MNKSALLLSLLGLMCLSACRNKPDTQAVPDRAQIAAAQSHDEQLPVVTQLPFDPPQDLPKDGWTQVHAGVWEIDTGDGTVTSYVECTPETLRWLAEEIRKDMSQSADRQNDSPFKRAAAEEEIRQNERAAAEGERTGVYRCPGIGPAAQGYQGTRT